jgi:hypothetical protein
MKTGVICKTEVGMICKIEDDWIYKKEVASMRKELD